jgi:hypothetical protein
LQLFKKVTIKGTPGELFLKEGSESGSDDVFRKKIN